MSEFTEGEQQRKSGFQRVRTNQWVRLVAYCLACLFTSCLYFGWQPYSWMLLKHGAYSWKCNPGSPVEDPDSPALCEEQYKAVSGLYSISNGTEFACAAVAGLLLDTFGPFVTGCIGELLHLTSLLFLIFSGEKFKALPFSMVVAGASVNIISFPALTVMEHWPERQALAVSLIVGCQSAASVVPLMLQKIWQANPSYTFKGIWGIWILVGWLPIATLYLLTLPVHRNYQALVVTSKELDVEKGEGVQLAASEPGVEPTPEPVTETIEDKAHGKAQWKLFFASVKTLDVWVMALFCFLLMFQFAYYPSVVADAVSNQMSDFVGWMTPLQGPFSVVIGFIMDYTGTTTVMLAMALTLIFVNLSCGYSADNNGLMRFVAVWFVFMQSATYNVKYTFVNEMYDPFNFGKLVGMLGIAGGVGVYCSNPLVMKSNYSTIFAALSGVAGFMVLQTLFIFWRQRNGVTHKTIRAVEQKNRQVNNVD